MNVADKARVRGFARAAPAVLDPFKPIMNLAEHESVPGCTR